MQAEADLKAYRKWGPNGYATYGAQGWYRVGKASLLEPREWTEICGCGRTFEKAFAAAEEREAYVNKRNAH